MTSPAPPSSPRPPRRHGTVAVSLLADLVRYVETRGVRGEDVLRDAGVAPAVLLDPERRIDDADMERVWVAAERLTGDHDIGLHAAEAPHPNALSIVGFVLQSAETLGEALDAASRWFAILDSSLALRARVVDDALHLTLATRDEGLPATAIPRHVAETVLLGAVRTLAALAGGSVPVRSVTFAHDAPAHGAAEAIRLFGTAVTYGAPTHRLVLEGTLRARPVLSPQGALRAAFEREADRLLTAVTNAEGTAGRVRSAIAARLRGSLPPLATVARTLAMSPRAVQRALRAEGTTYQAELDLARRDIARAELATGVRTAAEVGFLLGFAEPASFTRAFRRWTGEPPARFIARARAARRSPPSG